MAQVTFAKAIQRHAACPTAEVAGDSLRRVLDAYFELHPGARTYVLDERGSVRKHVAVFVNGQMIPSRNDLSRVLQPQDSVMVIQALTGG